MLQKIVLIRHGESAANIGEHNPQLHGDYCVPLTPRGREQAVDKGKILGPEIFRRSLVYCSPYHRTLQTLEGLCEGAGIDPDSLRIYEDPRIREMDFGYGNVNEQGEDREKHGWFFYRFHGGESPADCYDRTCTFLESMMREIYRKRTSSVVIVTHGVTIRCFVKRFMHLKVTDYDQMKNPENTDIVTIKLKGDFEGSVGSISNKAWICEGLKWYD